MKTKRLVVAALAALAPAAAFAMTYVVTAPPRGSRSEDTAMFSPLAAYLTKATGQKFVYKFPGNWMTYVRDMKKGRDDVIFDGPQFASWRIQHQGAVAILRLAPPLVFDVFSSKMRGRREAFSTIDHVNGGLIGRTVCVFDPPNLGEAVLMSQFKNPMARPYLVPINGWAAGYRDVVNGRCDAAILPHVAYARIVARHDGKTYQIWQSQAYPDQSITLSRRLVKAGLKGKIMEALAMPGGLKALAPIARRFANGKPFVPVSNQARYKGDDKLLKGFYGFY